ncbi:MAG TPA: LysM peptidoglycan-binding domain-containing protein [Cellulomonas sp.]
MSRSGARPPAVLALSATAALISATTLSVRLVSLAPDRVAGLTRVDDVIELAVLAAGALVAWWLTAGLAAAAGCACARALGRRWSTGERLVARYAPAIVRRGLALAVGTGIGLVSTVVPAGAQPMDPPADLGWVSTQAVAPAAAITPATTAPPVDPGDPAPDPAGQVTVQPGDSLWKIAADHLSAGATATDIATAWPRWYETNRAVVGDDPNRIRPGQVLTPPVAVIGPGGRS